MGLINLMGPYSIKITGFFLWTYTTLRGYQHGADQDGRPSDLIPCVERGTRG